MIIIDTSKIVVRGKNLEEIENDFRGLYGYITLDPSYTDFCAIAEFKTPDNIRETISRIIREISNERKRMEDAKNNPCD